MGAISRDDESGQVYIIHDAVLYYNTASCIM